MTSHYRKSLAALVLTVVAEGAGAEEPAGPEFDWSAVLGFRSRYLFSGLEFSDGSVEQAGVTMTYGGFSLSGFANYDNRTSELNEADFSGNYYVQFAEKAGIYFGAALYHFRNIKQLGKWDPTVELFLGVATSYPGNPSIHYARDYELTAGGQLLQFSLSHDVDIGSVGLTVGSRIVYNDNYYRDGANVSHYDLSLSKTLEFGGVTITPSVMYQNAVADDFSNYWVGAINLKADF